ncbi:MAG: hypothetical protein HS114_01685 [Anaerolineales bacterium]|nr:hypothetical protein [Anaerolineales bacterium]
MPVVCRVRRGLKPAGYIRCKPVETGWLGSWLEPACTWLSRAFQRSAVAGGMPGAPGAEAARLR